MQPRTKRSVDVNLQSEHVHDLLPVFTPERSAHPPVKFVKRHDGDISAESRSERRAITLDV